MAAQARNLGLISATASLWPLIVLTQNIKHVYYICLLRTITYTFKHNKKWLFVSPQKLQLTGIGKKVDALNIYTPRPNLLL